MPVTYCAEDDKLRLYVGRVPRDEYEDLMKAGFTCTPKQDCDFVAHWTPAREDLARQYLDDDEDIGDEDYSPTERAADRADRFSGYRDKRAGEATASADRYDAGPSAIGNQNLARAQRVARRQDRNRTYAITQWDKAEYWQQRTAGVIASALHKSSPKVRRGRILELEADQRRHLKSIEEAQSRYDQWAAILSMPGADIPLPLDGDRVAIKELNEAQRAAYVAANQGHAHFWHPTCQEANDKAKELWGHGFSAWTLLTDVSFLGTAFQQLSPKEVAELYVSTITNPSDTNTPWQRWSRHYEFRLQYEKAMLENEGGMAGDVDMVVGGWIGDRQITKINKSPATGRVCSVQVNAQHYTYVNGSRVSVFGPVTINVKRLGAESYRPPTDEELATFNAARKEEKAKSPTISLINPTDEDAQRLQDVWNRHAYSKRYANKQSEVLTMTQANYTAWSRGDAVRTVLIDEFGCECSRSDRPAVAKVRSRWRIGGSDSVIVLNDKKQSPLPVNWSGPVEESKPVELIEA